MSLPLTLHAPAKINLSLRILRKREDDFHELESLMVPVKGLFDTLHFREAACFSFHCKQEGVPEDESNLVVRAVRSFERASGCVANVEISLEKRIPHGAGLGGGSSDAAFTLLGLNRLFGHSLEFTQLSELAAELGADVPFFLHESPCICKGKGELIEKTTIPEMSVCLLKPSFAVSTPDVFKRWKSCREVAGFKYDTQETPFGPFFNDLEKPAFEKYLFLGEMKSWMLEQGGVVAAQMSGSGSTMFAVVDSVERGEILAQQAKEVWDPSLFTWCGSL